MPRPLQNPRSLRLIRGHPSSVSTNTTLRTLSETGNLSQTFFVVTHSRAAHSQ